MLTTVLSGMCQVLAACADSFQPHSAMNNTGRTARGEVSSTHNSSKVGS